MSVFPKGAVSHSNYPAGTLTPIQSDLVPSYDQVLELLRSRQSKRAYKKKAVEKGVIEKVLEAVRFAPSGHYAQSTEYVVIQDEKIIHEIGNLTAAGLKKLVVSFKNAIGRLIMRQIIGPRGAAYLGELAPEFEKLAFLYRAGTDIILHEPPVLLLLCADSVGGTFAGTNANIFPS